MSSVSPADFAAAALRAPSSDVESVEEIKHGLTNRSWLVRLGTGAVVVRVSADAEQALQIDRCTEDLILRAVAAAGIGAPVLLNDPVQRVLVTRYLGPAWTRTDACVAHNIVRLAGVLRELHSLAVPGGVRVVDLAASVDAYLTTLNERGVETPLRTDALRARAHSCAASLRTGASYRLCHNDVHHLNVVDDGSLHLIDWEYAGAGTPYFDLASVCVYHSYGASGRRDLLAAYQADGHVQSMEQLELACWLFEYIRDLWFAVR
jgi:thiamine kinase